MSGSASLGVPDHPRLRPGVAVLRRDAGQLQVVLSRTRSVVVADVEDVRDLLAALAAESGRSPAPLHQPTPRQREVLRLLHRADLLVDAHALQRDRTQVGRGLSDRVHAEHGPDAPRRLAARAAAQVSVVGRGETDDAQDTAAELVALLRRCGVGADRASSSAPGHVEEEPGLSTLVVLLDHGALPRDRVDPLLRSGTTHLVLSSDGPRIQVGPFTVPGTTACLRCVDAHHQQDDPRWGLVREQLAGLASHLPRPAPDAAARGLAIAWAAADVVRHVDGDRPATWSATLEIGGAATAQLRSWRRHPHCGCAWDVLPYGA